MQGQLCSRLPMTLSLLLLGDAALAYYRSERTATTRLLSGHVITPVIVPTQLMVNGMFVGTTTPVRTILAATVETNISSTVYKVNNATIVSANILASNGIIHLLCSVLVVPGADYPPQNFTTSSDPSASLSKSSTCSPSPTVALTRSPMAAPSATPSRVDTIPLLTTAPVDAPSVAFKFDFRLLAPFVLPIS
jgi:hypothetical protein